MSGTNEILQFASTNTGTNLLTQAEYTADAQRSTGNQPGIARSKLVNKALRQTSLLAAGLAEFIADYQANNITDSLTPQNIADYLLAAIQANIPLVPDASTTIKGKVQLATATEAQALASALLAMTPSTLNQALKGSNQYLSGNGYQKLPGGLILQWGTYAYGGNGGSWQAGYLSWNIAYPTACMQAVATGAVKADGGDLGTPGPIDIYCLDSLTTTNCRWRWDSNVSAGAGGTHYVRWFSVGY